MTSESLNLNSLATSLPSHSLNANAEKALLDNFKAAALSITTLYRSSRHASKRAYNAGYAAACRDLMEMLQLGVSDSHTLVPERNGETGMSIGRVMDWVEARLEAVRSGEEEEDEEDERERGAQSAPAPGSTSHLPTAATRKASPSPPPSRVTPSSPPRPSIPLKPTRTAPQSKATTSTPASPPIPPTLDFHVPVTFPFVENVPPLVTGSKRRHAVMMMPPPTSSAQSTPSSSSSPVPSSQRRRTRSMRGVFPHNHSQIVDGSMMDVEEDGRERKRVARR